MEKSSNQVAADLILNELLPRLKRKGMKIEDCPIPPELVGFLAQLKVLGIVTTHQIRRGLDAGLS